MQLLTFPIVLTESYMISPNVKHFVFQASISPAFHYYPGQFITIHFLHHDKMLKRSYSIANPPLSDNKIEFAASYISGGAGTNLLFNIKAGDTLQANGPFGRLILKDELPQRYILIATSTGITPYRAMLPSLISLCKKNPKLNVSIFQGVQKREDLLYLNDFLHFQHLCYPQGQFYACLSREKSTVFDYEYLGYVQNNLSKLTLNPLTDMVYLCGNPQMIDDTFAFLKEKEFSLQRIVREKYISTGK